MLFGSGMSAAIAVFMGLDRASHVVASASMYYGLKRWLAGIDRFGSEGHLRDPRRIDGGRGRQPLDQMGMRTAAPVAAPRQLDIAVSQKQIVGRDLRIDERQICDQPFLARDFAGDVRHPAQHLGGGGLHAHGIGARWVAAEPGARLPQQLGKGAADGRAHGAAPVSAS